MSNKTKASSNIHEDFLSYEELVSKLDGLDGTTAAKLDSLASNILAAARDVKDGEEDEMSDFLFKTLCAVYGQGLERNIAVGSTEYIVILNRHKTQIEAELTKRYSDLFYRYVEKVRKHNRADKFWSAVFAIAGCCIAFYIIAPQLFGGR